MFIGTLAAMDAGLPVDGIILAVSGLLALGLAGTRLAERTAVPGLLVSLGIGMAIGSGGLGWVHIGLGDLRAVEGASIAALALILYSGGLTTDVRSLRSAGVPAGLMATVGVGITMATVALVARPVFDLSTNTALLLGAVIASTDAAAIFSALRSVSIPTRVRSLLEVESGFNDPMAVLLTVGVLAAFHGHPSTSDYLWFAVRQIGGGALGGLVVGFAGAWALQRVRFHGSAPAAVAALTVAGLAYGAAAQLGGSGLLATYLAGVVVGARVTRHRRLIVGLHASLGEAAEIGLFLLLGLLVEPGHLPAQAGRAVVVAAVLVFVARPLAVGIVLPWFGFKPRELPLLAWAGLRGAVPIVLATFPLIEDHPAGLTIFNVVFFVVILSTAAQGLTVGPLARRLGLRAEEDAWSPVVEAVPVDRLGGELLEIDLGTRSPKIGHRLRDVPLPEHCRITAILRGEAVIVPDGDTELGPLDLLLVLAPTATGAAALSGWAEAPPP
jgi:cell volume regulation protein A